MTQREFRKKSMIILGLSVFLLACMIWDSAIFSDSTGESSAANAQTQTVKKASVTSGSALITNVQAVWISFGDYKDYITNPVPPFRQMPRNILRSSRRTGSIPFISMLFHVMTRSIQASISNGALICSNLLPIMILLRS